MVAIISEKGTWRRVNYFLSWVREDDMVFHCLGCYRVCTVGTPVVVQRSASEKTPNFWGPIEAMAHTKCWDLVPPHIRPPLGRRLNVWLKFGDIPWNGRW